MAEFQNNEPEEQPQENRSFGTGRKWAMIGCLLTILTVIAIIIVTFWVGSLSAIPGNDTVGP